MDIQRAREVLKKYFGYDAFRPMQAEIIETVLQGRDCVVLMPTGGGKSICFQVPAIVKEGVCIVISPLIALMKDQVEGLQENGVNAAFMNSSRSAAENFEVEQQALAGELDLLYVSPEKLLSEGFSDLLTRLKVSLIAIDEAHCISQWGHDFRPEYTQLGFLKQFLPEVPVIALTATADKLTRKDIQTQLALEDPEVFIASFDRPNLSLNVLPGRQRFEVMHRWIAERPGQSGIIYCLSRKSTEEIASKLRKNGVSACHYHAGMDRDARAQAQEDFINDDVPIVCATIAFGMGIDKSNVRWIIHYNLPKNIEGYYQEIGRAGRDGLPSDTLLFYSYADVVQLQGFIEDSGQAEIMHSKLGRMQQYANSSVCRRKVLLNYFSEQLPADCGNCDVCKNPPETFDGTVLAQKALSAQVRMKERVGSNLLIDVLRGSARKEIFERGYDRIKTYGAGNEVPRADWQQFVLQMLNMGLLEIAYDEHGALKVTEAGQKVLFEGEKVQLIRPRRKEKTAPKKQPKSVSTGNYDASLFERLRRLRKSLADKKRVPPYRIFHDAALKQMAEELPTTEVKMRLISGVGDRKYQLYGDVFINEILGFLQEG